MGNYICLVQSVMLTLLFFMFFIRYPRRPSDRFILNYDISYVRHTLVGCDRVFLFRRVQVGYLLIMAVMWDGERIKLAYSRSIIVFIGLRTLRDAWRLWYFSRNVNETFRIYLTPVVMKNYISDFTLLCYLRFTRITLIGKSTVD